MVDSSASACYLELAETRAEQNSETLRAVLAKLRDRKVSRADRLAAIEAARLEVLARAGRSTRYSCDSETADSLSTLQVWKDQEERTLDQYQRSWR